MVISKTVQTRLTALERRLQLGNSGRRQKTLSDFYKAVANGTSGLDSLYPDESKHHHSPQPAPNHAKRL